jgi:hypothetical protein
MSPLSGLFGKLFSRDRRKSDRLPAEELAAFYWTGAAPAEHTVRDISSTGLFLITEETWFPGTLIMLTLQKKDTPEGEPNRSIIIQTKAVRHGEDGVGLLFVFSESNDSRRGENLLKSGADRKSLDKFLKGFRLESGRAVVHSVVPPSDSE